MQKKFKAVQNFYELQKDEKRRTVVSRLWGRPWTPRSAIHGRQERRKEMLDGRKSRSSSTSTKGCVEI